MSEVVQDIKDKLDIVEVIRGYIEVKPAGRYFKANCPFHREKTPSFMISPERRTWHCFGGCNEGGDVISFVMKYENLEFYDALKILAEKAGIDPARLRGSAGEHKKYEALYAANETAKDFFRAHLQDEPAAYCRERGLAPETVSEFELGFAPHSSDALLRHLTGKGFSVSQIAEAGLVFRTERGTYWDRFRGRLMFPLYNATGRVVGFTGRIMPNAARPELVEGQAKYVNSPETPIFSKSKVLYGFHKSKSAIREANAAVLVEGQMDFLMAYQSGVKNTIAVSGTALTGEHLKTIRRLADKVFLCFDQDEAGGRATERAIDLALHEDLSVSIVALSDKDPADIVRAEPGKMATLIAAAEPVRDFYFNRYLPIQPPSNSSPLSIKGGVQALLVKIKSFGSPLEQDIWLKEVTRRTGIGEYALAQEMERIVEKAPSFKEVRPATRDILPMNRKARIIERIRELGGAGEGMESAEHELRAAYAVERMSEDGRAKELKALYKELQAEEYKERRAGAKAALIQAQALGDEKAIAAAMKEFDMVSRALHTGVYGETEGKKGET